MVVSRRIVCIALITCAACTRLNAGGYHSLFIYCCGVFER